MNQKYGMKEERTIKFKKIAFKNVSFLAQFFTTINFIA